jgi:NitT/TauT family transport system substrate-binding protein
MRRAKWFWLAALLVAALLAVVGCGGDEDEEAGGTGTGAEPAELQPVTVQLKWVTQAQFAGYYAALEEGYYEEEGLDVTFLNEIDANLVPKVGQGQVDIGMSDGTSVIPAVSQGIPVRYVATVYGQFPSIVFAKASSGISGAADLEGRKLGIPGRYGSSWIMLQALLSSAGLTPEDLEIVEYSDFGQGAAVAQGAVDAATGFANNEPVQLELSGEETVVLHVDDVTALPGPGLIVSEATADAKREQVEGFVRATLRAMREIAEDPEVGLDAATAAVPELGQDREVQTAILDATIAVWEAPGGSSETFGAIDRDGWAESIEFMTSLGQVPNAVTVDDLVSEAFLPAG